MKRVNLLFILCVMFLMLISTVSVVAGGRAEPADKPATGAELAASGEMDGGMTTMGFPITKEPITLKAVAMYQNIRPDMDKTRVLDWIEEKTNIRIEVEYVRDFERVDLMFASGDYPDILMWVRVQPHHLANAAEAGALVELEPLLPLYAPTWDKFMKENPLVYNLSLAPDGKLYGLPFIDFAPHDRNLRDQWIIMESWLKELGLSVPQTTDEFKEALLAIKANAGKGTIPDQVIPYYYFFDNYVGGQFDIYGSFGVYITDPDYLVVENGVVKYQATNPAIKEPLKFLRELYRLGLTPPEVFTDDWPSYVSKISSVPPLVGAYHTYANRHIGSAVAMPPLAARNGKTPLMRSQAYVPGSPNVTTIFSNNKYPIATLRLFEFIASDIEALMNVSRGMQGVVWDFNKDGKAFDLFWEESPDKMRENSMHLGYHNSWLALRDHAFHENHYEVVDYQTKDSRAWAYKEVYQGNVMPNSMVYVKGSLSQDDEVRVRQLATDINNFRKAKMAEWITGRSDIDQDWAAYVARLEALGLKEFIALRQKGYDMLFNR